MSGQCPQAGQVRSMPSSWACQVSALKPGMSGQCIQAGHVSSLPSSRACQVNALKPAMSVICPQAGHVRSVPSSRTCQANALKPTKAGGMIPPPHGVSLTMDLCILVHSLTTGWLWLAVPLPVQSRESRASSVQSFDSSLRI